MAGTLTYVIEDIPITPKQLAEAFWEMDDGEQAEFFNAIADQVGGKVFGLMLQMERTRSSDKLTVGGRLAQKIIGGDY